MSPTRKVQSTSPRYLYGIQYNSQDLKFAIIEASEGRVGSTVDRLILSCFHYDASEGRYGPYAFGIMRLGGVLTVILLGAALGVFWLRERRRRVHDAAPQEERDAVAGEGRTS